MGIFFSGFSSAVLVGRDLVDVTCIGWADREAQLSLQLDHIFRRLLKYKADHILCRASSVRRRAASDWMIR